MSDWLFRGLPARAAQTTAAPEVIEAQKFRLVDPTGKPRATLGLSEDGGPFLSLWDAAGEPRALVGSFSTADKRGGPQIEHLESTIMLLSENGAVLWQAP